MRHLLEVTAADSKAPVVEDAAKPVTVHPTAVAVDAAPIDLEGSATGGQLLADGTTIRPSSPSYVPPASPTEVVSLRDDNSKVTANADGTFTLEASSDRLNYRDANGAWQPIDLTLVTDPASGDLKVKGLDSDVTIGTGVDTFIGSVATTTGRATLRVVGYGAGAKVSDANVVAFPSLTEPTKAPEGAQATGAPQAPPAAPGGDPSPLPTASPAPTPDPSVDPAPAVDGSALPVSSQAPLASPTLSSAPLTEPSAPASPEPDQDTSPPLTGEAHITAAGDDLGLEFGAQLHDRTSPRAFAYILTVDDGTSVTVSPDGWTILLERTGFDDRGPKAVEVGRISAPFLSDANAVGPTEAATVAVLHKGDKSTDPSIDQSVLDGLDPNEVVLSYRLDDTWLDDPARVYPVTLDPTLCIQHGSTSCDPGNSYIDTYGGDNQANTYPTTPSTLRVGYDAIGSPDAVWGLLRSYIYFGQLALEDGGEVTAASLVLRQDINRDGANRNFLARPMKVGWGDTSTWNQLHDKVLSGLDSPNVLSCATDGTNCDLVFDVSKAVRAWYTRRGADWKWNAGFEVLMYSEGSTHAESDFYIGDDPSTIGGRPELRITYVVPKVGVDFAPEYGANYAPSSMLVGPTSTKLPVKVTNNASGFSFNVCASPSDADCYKFGYRFFNSKGAVSASANQDLPSTIASGATTPITLMVTPPTTAGTYTLRLDLVHRLGGSAGTYLWASDWAQPSKFNSRDKKVFATDNTRWTGSSVVERDEFGVTVAIGANPIGVQSVSTGDGGSLGIDLATRALHYSGAGGIGFADLIPLGLSYGYDSKNAAADCPAGPPTTYVGTLGTCGWYTNWDERLTDTSTTGNSGAFVYEDPSGSRYAMNTDTEGQVREVPGPSSNACGSPCSTRTAAAERRRPARPSSGHPRPHP